MFILLLIFSIEFRQYLFFANFFCEFFTILDWKHLHTFIFALVSIVFSPNVYFKELIHIDGQFTNCFFFYVFFSFFFDNLHSI